VDLRERNVLHNKRHPWETVRARFFASKITSLIGDKAVAVLDLGSGDCWFADQLLPKLPIGSQVTCCDINFTDADIAASKGKVITRTREIPAQQFDVIVMLDVIEHIEHEANFLHENVRPHLKSNGTVLISVPAHPSLFTAHDTFLGHYRRYTRKQLLNVASLSFTTSENGYLFSSLAVARWFQSVLPNKKATSENGVGAWSAGPLITALVLTALHADAAISRLIQKLNLRVPGLTVWTICRAQTTTQDPT
jgi:SAM-dependent methyltransferase